ncbi:MAG: hypothetical protein IJ716_14615 [Lachnospiraceae bacterium]|nr:hypothetical protein [Lachnospiraceae bacterium]
MKALTIVKYDILSAYYRNKEKRCLAKANKYIGDTEPFRKYAKESLETLGKHAEIQKEMEEIIDEGRVLPYIEAGMIEGAMVGLSVAMICAVASAIISDKIRA